MLAGGPLPSLEAAFSLIIRKRCPSRDTSKLRTVAPLGEPGVRQDRGRVEELRGIPRHKCRRQLDGHSHDARPAGKKQLMPIGRPHRRPAAATRNLTLPVSYVWKRPHVDLRLAGLVRFVRHPMSVGRNLRITLVERRLQKRFHSRRAVQGQEHEVETRRWPLFLDYQARAIG